MVCVSCVVCVCFVLRLLFRVLSWFCSCCPYLRCVCVGGMLRLVALLLWRVVRFDYVCMCVGWCVSACCVCLWFGHVIVSVCLNWVCWCVCCSVMSW